MILKSFFFWQPQFDFLKYFETTAFGKAIVVVLNYLIWAFLFYISYLLIRSNTNIFWQLLVATLIGEVVEKYGKSHALWRRPLYQRNDSTPVGLVDRWYKTGSFPSGHTIKAVFFFLFVLQYPVFSPTAFLLITTPLLFFRILIGFHYPLDMLGGTLIGFLIWFSTHQITFPETLTNIVRVIFNFIFHI
jgi:membrane-associated phospholipid phosphatase